MEDMKKRVLVNLLLFCVWAICCTPGGRRPTASVKRVVHTIHSSLYVSDLSSVLLGVHEEDSRIEQVGIRLDGVDDRTSSAINRRDIEDTSRELATGCLYEDEIEVIEILNAAAGSVLAFMHVIPLSAIAFSQD